MLWVYADDDVANDIPSAVAGKSPLSPILGYPPCCEGHHSEQKIVLGEAYVEGIVNAYPGSTPEQVIELWKKAVQVPVAVNPDADIPQTRASLQRFPYVQFVACPACLASEQSPAALANARARDLAFEMGAPFGRSIWQSRDWVANRGKAITVGRNDPCPCGRGAKYKKCCLS